MFFDTAMKSDTDSVSLLLYKAKKYTEIVVFCNLGNRKIYRNCSTLKKRYKDCSILGKAVAL